MSTLDVDLSNDQAHGGEALLRIGATDASRVSGDAGLFVPLFPFEPPCPHAVQLSPSLVGATDRTLFANVPNAYLCALQMVGHDLFEGMALPDSSHSKVGVVNRKSGALLLSPVYGGCALSGDVSAILERCRRSPWDSARLWVEEPSQKGAGDLLRLHRVILGDGATLSEYFFERLPRHFRARYFEYGDLMLHRAVVADIRSDQSLLLSQFHYSIAVAHNQVVADLEQAFGHIADRRNVYQNAREIVLSGFAELIISDVLPKVCDPRLLSFVVSRAAPLYRRAAGTAGGRPFVPTEAPTLLEGLFGFVSARRIRANPACLEDHGGLAPTDHTATEPYAGLPRGLFVSRRVPTRLSPKHTVEWPSHLSGQATSLCGAAPVGAAERVQWALNLGVMMNLPSGQVCATAARTTYDVDIPTLSAHDVAEWYGLPSSQPADQSPLLPYVVAEAGLLGKGGRLGPLGTLIVAETIVGAVNMLKSNIRIKRAPSNDDSWTLEKFLMKSAQGA